MTQEDKELLLKDLCTRLPYGVKVCARFNTGNRYTVEITAISLDRDYVQIRQNDLHSYTGSSIEDIRPYLRQMSSMTEEEVDEWEKASNMQFDMEDGFLDVYDAHLSVDWLNARGFDYRGLIPKGLALEAPKGMYKIQ